MIALKALAIGLILAATTGLARLAAQPYRLRVRVLEEWQRLLRRLAPLIEWRQLPLAEALGDASRGLSMLQPAMAALTREMSQRDGDFSGAWGRALNGQPGLWPDDFAALIDLGRVLGVSDAANQHTHLLTAQADLDRLAGEARRRLAQDGRLFPALVSAVGVMVVILLV